MPVNHITRAHVLAFVEGLKVLPQRQGRRTDGVEALARIEEGRSKRLPSPSKGSVAKKLLHVRPFLVWTKRKGWVGQDVIDELALALENADAAVLKAKSTKKIQPGYVALSAVELTTLFEQHAFLAGAIRADWSYWIPLLCLYQGLRVSEASQLYTNDVVAVDGVSCLSVISDASDDDDDVPPHPLKRQRRSFSGRISPAQESVFAPDRADPSEAHRAGLSRLRPPRHRLRISVYPDRPFRHRDRRIRERDRPFR